MNYKIVRINPQQSDPELIMALLMQIVAFDSFEEKEESLDAYIEKDSFNEQTKLDIQSLAKQLGFTYQIEHLQNKNWNEVWEASFQPVDIDSFSRIRATFHPANPNVKYDLVIDPKMAFGTGHHETTYMMVKMMSSLNFSAQSVMDFGCGTGILAILASKMRAFPIYAVDIEQAAYQNTLENIQLNEVENIKVFQGELDCVNKQSYDIILANINRNVILSSLSELKSLLNTGGQLLISGILKTDEPLILDAIQKNDYKIGGRLEKGDWVCILLLK